MTVDDLDDIAWDDTVDVVCVGPGRAALAAAVGAAAAGLDVLLVADRGELGETAVGFLSEMTADLEPLEGAVPALPFADDAASARPTDFVHVSFSGPALLEWARTCLGSPYGLVCTTATAVDTGLLPVGIADADLDGWLARRADDLGVEPAEAAELRDLVLLGGAVAGVVIGGPDGESLVRAEDGVLLATGEGAALPALGADQVGAELVVRSRPYSRFARLELRSGQDGTAS